ncbi:MAG: FtsW/RodA/SpoVE family cell cycle protein [Clostridia bacterium]|nr:FtsW/RodA/SpoVE family cell cycle protein [Clostridia bacterium]
MKKFFSVTKRFIQETDNLLLILIIATSIFGVLMVYSTTRCILEDGQTIARDATVMIIAAVAGILLTLVISAIDYEFIMKLWPIIGGFCILLMVVTLIFGVAPEARPDSKCWLAIGDIYFQSSELVKIGYLITYSMHLELLRDKINNLSSIILLGIHAMIPIGLVVLTGDMGSALVFIFMTLGMLFFAGLHWGYFACGGILTLAVSPLIWLYVFSDYQKKRFLALIRPEQFEDESYQQLLGLNALGSGGFWGTGFAKGVYTQGGIVPESENDMIFTAIGEETGFFGCMVALGLLFAIVYKIIKIAKKTRDFSTQIFCYGMAVMISSQILINIGMCLMILPVIGITLPFFSAGGSSTLCLYIGIGLVFSIYRFNRSREAVNFRLSRISTPFSEF